jgi:hypothetical protein
MILISPLRVDPATRPVRLEGTTTTLESM